MRLQWTTNARRDLIRLHDFLTDVNPPMAGKVVNYLVKSAEQIRRHPQIGSRLDQYAPRDVRRVVSGNYEIRYEVTETAIVILRLWHTLEDR